MAPGALAASNVGGTELEEAMGKTLRSEIQVRWFPGKGLAADRLANFGSHPMPDSTPYCLVLSTFT